MKKFSSCIVMLLSMGLLNLHAQVNLPLRLPNNLRPTIEKVLATYTEHYKSLQGDVISVTENSIVYNSRIRPEAAEDCTLIQYLNTEKNDYSWQALMFRSDDFAAASKKYNTCCQQLKNLVLRAGGETCKMDGEYEAPGETKSFYSTVLAPAGDSEIFDKLRVEVLLESDMTQWTLRILIYDRVHDDREGNLN